MNNLKNVILVCEDKSFLSKINDDFNLNIVLTIIYEKRKITSLKFSRNIFFIFFRKTTLITEYPNLVPRLISLITFSKINAIIYGFLNSKNFKKKLYKVRFLNLIYISLYADYYYIINREGTFNTLKSIFGIKRVKLIKLTRPKLFLADKKNNDIIWISQCWGEIGELGMEEKQQKCINYFHFTQKLIIVSHPRDKTEKYKSFNYIDSILDFKKYILNNGAPKLVLGFTSSALLEINEMGVNVKRITDCEIEKIILEEVEFQSIDKLEIRNIENIIL